MQETNKFGAYIAQYAAGSMIGYSIGYSISSYRRINYGDTSATNASLPLIGFYVGACLMLFVIE